MFQVLLANIGNYDFANLLNQLDQLGFFKYILPFLLIFAVVYAILTKTDIFKENKGAAILISFAIGLLILQLNYVSDFFQIVFPKFGVGLTFLLLALILAGAFLPLDKDGKNTYFSWIFFSLGSVIFLILVVATYADWNIGSNWWTQYGALTIVAVVIVVAMVLVMVLSKKD